MNIPQLDGGYDEDDDYNEGEESDSSSPYTDVSEEEDDDVEQEVKTRSRQSQLKENVPLRTTRQRNKKKIKPSLAVNSSKNQLKTPVLSKRGRPSRQKLPAEIKSPTNDSGHEASEEMEMSSICPKCQKPLENVDALKKHAYWCDSSRITRSKTGDIKPSFKSKTLAKKKDSINPNVAACAPTQQLPQKTSSTHTTPTRKRGRPRKIQPPESASADETDTVNLNQHAEEEEEIETPQLIPVNETSSYDITTSCEVEDTDGPAVCPKCKMRYRNLSSLQNHLPTCTSSSDSSSECSSSEEEEEENQQRTEELFSHHNLIHSSADRPQDIGEVENRLDTMSVSQNLVENTSGEQLSVVNNIPDSIYPTSFSNNIIGPRVHHHQSPPVFSLQQQSCSTSRQEFVSPLMSTSSPPELHMPTPVVAQKQEMAKTTTVTVQDPQTGNFYRMEIPLHMVSAAIQQQHPQIAASFSQPQLVQRLQQPEENHQQRDNMISTLSQSDTCHSSAFSQIEQQGPQHIQQLASYLPNQVQEIQMPSHSNNNRFSTAQMVHGSPEISQLTETQQIQLHHAQMNSMQLQFLQQLQSAQQHQFSQMHLQQPLVRPQIPQMITDPAATMQNHQYQHPHLQQNSFIPRHLLMQQNLRPSFPMISSHEPNLVNYSQLQQNSLHNVPISQASSPKLTQENFGIPLQSATAHVQSSFMSQGHIPSTKNVLPQFQYNNMNIQQQVQLAQQQAFHSQMMQQLQMQQYLSAQAQCQQNVSPNNSNLQPKQSFQVIPPNSSPQQRPQQQQQQHINGSHFANGSQPSKMTNPVSINHQAFTLPSSHNSQQQPIAQTHQFQPRSSHQIIVSQQESTPSDLGFLEQMQTQTNLQPVLGVVESNIALQHQQRSIQNTLQQQHQQQLQQEAPVAAYQFQFPSGGGIVVQQQPYQAADKYRRVLPLPMPRPIEPKPAAFVEYSERGTTQQVLTKHVLQYKPKTIKAQLADKILEKTVGGNNSNSFSTLEPVHINAVNSSELEAVQNASQRKIPLTAVVRPMEHPLQKLSDQISQIESIFNDSQPRHQLPLLPPSSVITARPQLPKSVDAIIAAPVPPPLNCNSLAPAPSIAVNNQLSKTIVPPTTPKRMVKKRAPVDGGKSPTSIRVTLKRMAGEDAYSVNNVTGGDSEINDHFKSLKISARITNGEMAGVLTDVMVEPKIHIIPNLNSDELDSNFTIPEDLSSIPIIPAFTQMENETETASQQQQTSKLTHRAVVLYHVTNGTNNVIFRSSDVRAIWSHIFQAAQGTRIHHDLPPLSYPATPISLEENQHEPKTNFNMGGLTHRAVQFLLKHLPKNNNLESQPKQSPVQQRDDEVVKINDTGCARTEVYVGRKTFDMFGWLASKHRKPLETIASLGEGLKIKTNTELHMTARYRAFKEKPVNGLMVMWSTIHGRGLYTRRGIEKGEIVIEYCGEVIRFTVCDQREKFYETKGIGCYMFKLDDENIIDATMKGSAARFINHSCEPNCESKTVRIEGKLHILICALRIISAGEELTYDYKFEKERKEKKIPCACASRKCKKYLN